MAKAELIKFCMENGLLINNEALEILSEEDSQLIKKIIYSIKQNLNKKVITKEIFLNHKEKIDQLLLTLPQESRDKIENIKLKLGLKINLTKEITLKRDYFKKKNLGVKVLTNYLERGRSLEVKDFINLFRYRFKFLKQILEQSSILDNLISINKISMKKQNFSIIGMVVSKRVTKNKNLILEVEDLTGMIRLLVSKEKKELYEKVQDLLLDAVCGFKGVGNREFFFLNEMIQPEIGLSERKKAREEEYALFLSDLHIGSKNFMEKNFLKFIDYLNGEIPNTPVVKKIKYIVISGDFVTGVGVYPNQERDLLISNLEEQFLKAAELLGKIRKDIKIIISPGEHDGVRLMEPQPPFDEKFAWPLNELENVILVGNPCVINIASDENFSGLNVLIYHGHSFSYIVDAIPSLLKIKAMNFPEKIMIELLKNRHLAPTHGSTQYFPSEQDFHLIKEVPDIFVSGHTHKSSVVYHNNILIISGSSWEKKTPHQEKMGNVPDHCKVPMVNLKTRSIKILDFE